MTIETLFPMPFHRDIIAEATTYLNRRFRGEEDMKMRIGNHLMDYAEREGFFLSEPEPDRFVLHDRMITEDMVTSLTERTAPHGDPLSPSTDR